MSIVGMYLQYRMALKTSDKSEDEERHISWGVYEAVYVFAKNKNKNVYTNYCTNFLKWKKHIKKSIKTVNFLFFGNNK